MKFDSGDGVTNRAILLGARIRFSPTGASIREKAIVRIIEQNLACLDKGLGLTAEELCEIVCFAGHRTILRDADVREGIRLLKDNGRIGESPVDGRPVYSLSKIASDEIRDLETECRRRDYGTLRYLFGNSQGNAQDYALAFFDLLSFIFSRVTDIYIQSITMGGRTESFINDRVLEAAINQAVEHQPVPDRKAFSYGAKLFFRESKPEFDQLKWNMAQNYYVAKALGSDKSADLLSVEVLKGAFLYCDTNVLIAALVPKCRHHNSFRELLKSCSTIGMKPCTAFITVRELQAVITAHGDLLRKVADKIPDATKLKVRSFLYESFLAEKELDPNLSVDLFLSRFNLTVKQVEKDLSITVIDDKIFEAIAKDSETIRLGHELATEYESIRRKKKSEKVAAHDAELIIYVRKENDASRKSWIVTLDTTLAAWRAKRDNETCRLITLDALLQWLTPVAAGTSDEDLLAEIFSESLRYQILPRDVFFDLRDFQVFADMEIETAQLPAEDVEACIRDIHKNCINLDPSQSADREKIGRVIQRYFADPGTKFKRRIDELQIQSKNLSDELAEEKLQRINAGSVSRNLRRQAKRCPNRLRPTGMPLLIPSLISRSSKDKFRRMRRLNSMSGL